MIFFLRPLNAFSNNNKKKRWSLVGNPSNHGYKDYPKVAIAGSGNKGRTLYSMIKPFVVCYFLSTFIRLPFPQLIEMNSPIFQIHSMKNLLTDPVPILVTSAIFSTDYVTSSLGCNWRLIIVHLSERIWKIFHSTIMIWDIVREWGPKCACSTTENEIFEFGISKAVYGILNPLL